MTKRIYLIAAALLILSGADSASPLIPLQGNVPGYKLKTLAGKRISLKDYRGSPLLINFWATWCVPCRKEFPIIKEIQNKFGKDGLVVLAVNVDDTRSISGVKSFVSAHSLDFIIPLDPNRKLFNNFHGSSLPLTLLIDASGNVVRTYSGFLGVWEEELDQQLTELVTGGFSQNGE
ncbi:TlpA family protein disulfide reductase [Candidatus Marinimicrobia bacterium MT.SAG.3]|nr:TlpA family protein disulfide reductase [Candidatus Marinimicrobia bacterium MT.SAG.3]